MKRFSIRDKNNEINFLLFLKNTRKNSRKKFMREKSERKRRKKLNKCPKALYYSLR
jgi:hypothetical protein